MPPDLTKTLTELERNDWGPPLGQGGLIDRCHAARRVPVGELSADQLRMLLGQDIGTPLLLRRAVELVLSAPELDGDLFPGALLNAVCGVKGGHWRAKPELWLAMAPAVERIRGGGLWRPNPEHFGALAPQVRQTRAGGLDDFLDEGLRQYDGNRPPPERLEQGRLALLADVELRDTWWKAGGDDTGPRDAALDALVAEHVDDSAHFEVYGDWLLTHGEPRGELVRLQRLLGTGEDPAVVERAVTLLDAHRARWLGPLADVKESQRTVSWRWGFVDSVTDDHLAAAVGNDGAGAWGLGRFLERPAAAALRHLTIELEESWSTEPLSEVVRHLPPLPALRTLKLRSRLEGGPLPLDETWHQLFTLAPRLTALTWHAFNAGQLASLKVPERVTLTCQER